MIPARPPLLALLLGLALTGGCVTEPPGVDDPADPDEELPPGESCADDEEGLVRPDGWGLLSHCKGADPNYDLLFDDSVVHRIDLEMATEDAAAQLADLADILGGGGGGPADVTEEPMWVPVTVRFGGDVWGQVGMRYKGNSSLRSSYQSGVRKFPFRLSFDKYEDDSPERADQRFWGFKKMTFSSAFKDASLMRDKVGADLFRASGVPAARGAFAAVYVDSGEGPVYFGLYTMIEDPSNKMLSSQFDDDSGNLYKPDGTGARLQTFDEASLIKKTNEEEADFSDAQELIAVLNGDRSDAAAWRAQLEGVFDVDRFLTLLALNQAMVNWDSYGWMTHNYYLYADPSDDGRFVWIPWDLNESLFIQGGGGGPPGGGGPGGGGGGPGGGTSDSVLLDEIGAEWPMIRNVLDDAVYAQRYEEELEAALLGAFEASALEQTMSAYHALIAPFVVGDDGEQAPYTNLSGANSFEASVVGAGGLVEHVQARHEAVSEALGL